MRVMMISENDIASTESLGVTKKIMGQFHAFQKIGCDVYSLCLKDGQGVLLHEENTEILFPSQIKNYIAYVKLFSLAVSLCRKNRIEMCYIRYPLADWVFMGMVKKLHKLCKVVVEIPTYPYDQEADKNRNIISKINHLQDKKNRRKLDKYIDYIVSFGNESLIYGIKCINISNGLDLSTVKYLGDQLCYENDVSLIGVARVAHFHGFDRIIEGMKEYYAIKKEDKNRVFFHIIGNGDEVPNLKALASAYNLLDYVHFHGTLSGDLLERAYKNSHIGVSHFGDHRIGISVTSCLKNREYCAIGIPFIGSIEDAAIDKNQKFYRLYPSNDDPINIDDVVQFFQYIKGHHELHAEMRQYAINMFSWEKQLKKVLNTITI